MEELLQFEIFGEPLMEFLESPRKISHIVAHSHLISLISFRRLACKEEVVKVIETLMGINVWAGVWEGVKP